MHIQVKCLRVGNSAALRVPKYLENTGVFKIGEEYTIHIETEADKLRQENIELRKRLSKLEGKDSAGSANGGSGFRPRSWSTEQDIEALYA